MRDALISIKPMYVQKILDGIKSVEIRSRRVILLPGTRLWIYSTLPKGCLEAVAIVDSVEIDSPALIWQRYHEKIGISHSIFRSYINGSKSVSAIFLNYVRELNPSVSLDFLRSKIQGFHPPQFIIHIDKSNPIFALLRERLQDIILEKDLNVRFLKGLTKLQTV